MRSHALWPLALIAACSTVAGLDRLTFAPAESAGGGGATAAATGGGGAGGQGEGGAEPPRSLFFYEGSPEEVYVVAHDRDSGAAERVSCAMDGSLLLLPLAVAAFGLENDVRDMGTGAHRVAFVGLDPDPMTGHRALWVADPTSRCDGSTPVRVDLTPHVAPLPITPRFSPDGMRIAYLEAAEEGNGLVTPERLVTVAVDGTDARVIRTNADIPGGTIFPAPPSWQSGSGRIAWVETSTGSLRVWTSADEPFGDKSELFSCPATEIESLVQVELFASGGEQKIAVVARVPDDAQGGAGGAGAAGGAGGAGGNGGVAPPLPTNLRAFIVNASADCAALQEVFPSDPPLVIHRELAVAPDGQTMVHASTRDNFGVQLWLSTITGADLAICDASVSGVQEWGPIWLDGGASLVWTRAPFDSTSVTGSELMIADVEGTTCSNVRRLLPEPVAVGESRMFGRRGTCAFSPPPPSSPHLPGWLLACVALIFRVRLAGRS